MTSSLLLERSHGATKSSPTGLVEGLISVETLALASGPPFATVAVHGLSSLAVS